VWTQRASSSKGSKGARIATVLPNDLVSKGDLGHSLGPWDQPQRRGVGIGVVADPVPLIERRNQLVTVLAHHLTHDEKVRMQAMRSKHLPNVRRDVRVRPVVESQRYLHGSTMV